MKREVPDLPEDGGFEWAGATFFYRLIKTPRVLDGTCVRAGGASCLEVSFGEVGVCVKQVDSLSILFEVKNAGVVGSVPTCFGCSDAKCDDECREVGGCPIPSCVERRAGELEGGFAGAGGEVEGVGGRERILRDGSTVGVSLEVGQDTGEGDECLCELVVVSRNGCGGLVVSRIGFSGVHVVELDAIASE